LGLRKYAKEKRNESEEQHQGWTAIRHHSRLMRRLRFRLQSGTREVWERRTAMKVKSNLKAGQQSATILD
jgi:hypothetical protein